MLSIRLVVLLIIGIGCGPAALATELSDAIESIRTHHGISATAYFVVSARAIEEIEALGTTRTDTTERFTLDHLVRIGSITKSFTALAAILLEERNLLALDNPVSEVLPDPPFVNQWSDQRPVKIVHLIEHTGGLRDLSKREFDFNRPVALEDAFQIDPESRRLAWPPGLHSSYSNSGAGIVSLVIEKVSERPYETFVADEIFARLGMSSARFIVSKADRQRLIAGYDRDGRTPIDYWHTLYRGFGAISVSPRDMLPFVQLFLNEGQHGSTRLVSRAAMGRMRRPQTTLAARSGLAYGYGLGIYQYQRGGVSFFGHGGDADGYLAYFAFSLESKQGYFVAINAFNNDALLEMRRKIEDKIIRNTTVEPHASVTLGNGQPQNLIGTYRQETARFGEPSAKNLIEVSLSSDGTLQTSTPNGRRRALVPVTNWHFRRTGQTVATIAFIPCGDQIFLQGDFGNYVKRLKDDSLAPCNAATTP